MKMITLKVDDSVSEKLLWFLKHFPANEIEILEQSDYLDDDYLRSIAGMKESILEARQEANEKGVTIDKLDW